MDLLDDFDDGLADLVGMDEDQHRESVGGPPSDLLKPRKLSQVIAESGRAAKKAKVGDLFPFARGLAPLFSIIRFPQQDSNQGERCVSFLCRLFDLLRYLHDCTIVLDSKTLR